MNSLQPTEIMYFSVAAAEHFDAGGTRRDGTEIEPAFGVPLKGLAVNSCVRKLFLLATLTSWAETAGVAYQGVPVGTIKRHATGKGNANKEAMMAAARARGFSPADDNEADAIAILLWALETRGGVQ